MTCDTILSTSQIVDEKSVPTKLASSVTPWLPGLMPPPMPMGSPVDQSPWPRRERSPRIPMSPKRGKIRRQRRQRRCQRILWIQVHLRAVKTAMDSESDPRLPELYILWGSSLLMPGRSSENSRHATFSPVTG